ncbi:conserved protein of unknown function [Ectopseudomonas oleovorans]|uniref:Uncharacterized protein n=1 Tax=Ectopseudomonas oleovorans TaxID=301 RepID=A0A653BBD2_ECTOL|nr:conserved protein of unknown function [Pseudomonas oleovorans]
MVTQCDGQLAASGVERVVQAFCLHRKAFAAPAPPNGATGCDGNTAPHLDGAWSIRSFARLLKLKD